MTAQDDLKRKTKTLDVTLQYLEESLLKKKGEIFGGAVSFQYFLKYSALDYARQEAVVAHLKKYLTSFNSLTPTEVPAFLYHQLKFMIDRCVYIYRYSGQYDDSHETSILCYSQREVFAMTLPHLECLFEICGEEFNEDKDVQLVSFRLQMAKELIEF